MVTSIRHLNCATMRPGLRRLPGPGMPDSIVAHVLLVETERGLTLVDTGFGTEDVRERGARLPGPFVRLIGPAFDPGETALAQLPALGYAPGDVRDVILTHLDLDHASGLADFPAARVHLHATELQAARAPRLRERTRYIAAQWRHGPEWVEHGTAGEDWFGFGGVRAIGDDVLLIPLHGHTRGHSGVAVRRPGGDWYLHAGDAYFHSGDLAVPRDCPLGLRLFQELVQADRGQRIANLERLQELHARHDTEVTIFSAHDAGELAALAGRTD